MRGVAHYSEEGLLDIIKNFSKLIYVSTNKLNYYKLLLIYSEIFSRLKAGESIDKM